MNYGVKKLYVGGKLKDASSGNTFKLINPDSEEVIAQMAWASKGDTQATLLAAQQGFKTWSKLSVADRVTWILKLRDKLVQNEEKLRTAVMYEMGKVWEGTEEDFTSITNALSFYADEISKRTDIEIPDREGTHTHTMVSQPLGVVVAFLAYNFPLLNLGFKLGPALAAGCSIIIKPSEFSPLSAYLIGEMCEEINFPAGVINIISGDVENVGIPLCESTIPSLITMIGSTETAQKLIQQSSKTSIKRYSMECGGNAPFIVMPDADLEAAINLAVALKVGNSGQICVAPNRFLVHESIINKFIEGMVSQFEFKKVGFGRANKPDMGPLANKASVEKVQGLVDEAIAQGSQLFTGGKRMKQKGFYYPPTALQVPKGSAVLQKEIFGPVAFVVPFANKEEALEIANDTDAGLASYVFSKNHDTLQYFAQNLEFGEVQLNGVKYDIYLPHGGIKNSGIGVDCSIYALEDYLIKKRVTLALN